MESLSLSIFIKHGIIAFFGALVQALVERREGRSKTFADLVILTIIGSFAGVIFGLLALNFFPHNQYISLAITGAGAVLGKEGLKVVANKLLDMLRITIDKNDERP